MSLRYVLHVCGSGENHTYPSFLLAVMAAREMAEQHREISKRRLIELLVFEEEKSAGKLVISARTGDKYEKIFIVEAARHDVQFTSLEEVIGMQFKSFQEIRIIARDEIQTKTL